MSLRSVFLIATNFHFYQRCAVRPDDRIIQGQSYQDLSLVAMQSRFCCTPIRVCCAAKIRTGLIDSMRYRTMLEHISEKTQTRKLSYRIKEGELVQVVRFLFPDKLILAL